MSTWPKSIHDYSFSLPDELIAQEPSLERTKARLLVIRRNPKHGMPRFEHLLIEDLPRLAKEEDTLKNALWVRNRSRVLRARIYARRPSGSRHEIVLLRPQGGGLWTALVKGQSVFKYPEKLIEEKSGVEFFSPSPGFVSLEGVGPDLDAWLEKAGEVPLPPYIKKREDGRDRLRYQSVWARGETKSVAAPTASLHFSESLVGNIEEAGGSFCDVYLHVGLGTFEPVRVENIFEHELHTEEFFVSAESLSQLKQSQGRPRVAVGTTALRVLETLTAHAVHEGDISGETRLFVRPGFEISQTQALLTNFHLPESTLFILVSVFAGSLSLAKEAYALAVEKKYRFFSYGDATLWL